MNIKEERIDYNSYPISVMLTKIIRTCPHFHSSDLEIIFCLEGSVDLVAGHQTITIQEHELFSVDCRDIHYLSSEADNTVLIFHLDLTALQKDFEYLKYVLFACESSHCYSFQQEAMTKVKDLVLAFASSFFSETLPIFEYHKAANQLVDILLEYFNWFNYENQDNYINQAMYDRFHNVVAHCFKNYKEKITIAQLAESEHISRNYFSQFMSKTVFMNFNTMLKFIRGYEAEHLLLTTDLQASEVSYLCGFSDPKYFYSTFRLMFDCTPTKHRLQYAEYMKKEPEFITLSKSDSFKIINDYIAKWHVQKLLIDAV